MTFSKVKYQFFAAMAADLLVFGIGINVGWYSPVLPYLSSDESPLLDGPLTTDMSGWIGAALSIGSLCGVIAFGTLALWTGFKASILIASIPITIGWLLIIFGEYSWQLLLSRFMSGMAIGGFYTVMPTFVAEISSDYIRGQINTVMQIFCFTGVLIGYIGASYMSYTINPLVMITVPIISAVLFWFVPESPQYLLRANKPEAAEKSLRFYRNCKVGGTDEKAEDDLKAEYDKFVAIAKQNEAGTPLQFQDFTTPIAMRTLVICIFLMAVNQFSGSFAIATYAVTIFNSSGSSIDAEISSIVMAVIQVVATYAASQLIDRAGRKLLLLASTGVGCVSLMITGTYSYLVTLEWDMTGWDWIPLVTISVYIFMGSIGILPVPYVMMTEVLPPKIRKVGTIICSCAVYVCQTAMLKTMPILLESLQLFGSMYFFAVVLFAGFVFTIFVVTETKGINLDVLVRPDEEADDEIRKRRSHEM